MSGENGIYSLFMLHVVLIGSADLASPVAYLQHCISIILKHLFLRKEHAYSEQKFRLNIPSL